MVTKTLEMTIRLQFYILGWEIVDEVKGFAIRKGLNYFEKKFEDNRIAPGALFPHPVSIVMLHVVDMQNRPLIPDSQYSEIKLCLNCSEHDINLYFLNGDTNISEIVSEFKKSIRSIDSI